MLAADSFLLSVPQRVRFAVLYALAAVRFPFVAFGASLGGLSVCRAAPPYVVG